MGIEQIAEAGEIRNFRDQEAVNLEDDLVTKMFELKISEENQKSVYDYLCLLKKKDMNTYKHSLRVALLGTRVARHMHLDEKVLLYAGALHDLGKSLIDVELLRKTVGFDEKDMKKMSKHPVYTYYLLKDVHEFSAEVALRHHYWQEKGYPKRFPRFKKPFSKNTKLMINLFSRVLGLVDFYDAATSRVNDKFGEVRKLTPDETKEILLKLNSDQKVLIEDLYINRIFGEEYTKPITESQGKIYQEAWKDFSGKRSPDETRRQVQLALAMEPLSEKIGCTTREKDCSRNLRLEYFIAGAINVGDAFAELAKRVLASEKQPLIYDLSHKAQLDCTKNRIGGRINHGIIEMLMPIITAQMLYDRDYKLGVEEILEKAIEVMKNSSREDIDFLIKTKRIAYDLSAYDDREIPVYPESKNIYQYYHESWIDSKTETGKAHNYEFVKGFPTIGCIYKDIKESDRYGLNKKVEDAYSVARRESHPDVGYGLTADCIAVALYLMLSHHPKDKIIT